MPNTENNYQETDLGNVAPNPKGEYSDTVSYEYLDTVSYEGGSYMCVADAVTGIAPVAGENTTAWQILTLPGGLTPEYVSMHDNVVSKANQVESSRAVVEQAQQEVEAVKENVQQLHSDTVAASQGAEESRDSAAGYAQAAETSRTAAETAESNVNAQVNGFDEHVSQQTEKATEDIIKARQQAISAVESQQTTSIQYVKDQTADYTEAKKKEISDTTETVKNTVEEAGTKQIQAIADSLDKNLDTEGKAADAGATGKAIGGLKSTLENANKSIEELADKKITKFYASNQAEDHLMDSDNGKIQDMMVYGKSEQKKYGGYQLIPLGLKNANGTILSLPYTRDGITINITDDGKGFSVKGTNTTSDYADFYITKANEISLGAGTYTRSGKGFTKDIQMVSGGGVGAGGCLQYRLDSADFSTTETVEAGLSGNHILRIPANATVNTTVYYQLEKGSEAHDYEPYTGGAPSPSPDYPQEIRSVVKPTLKVVGKNLVKSYRNDKTSKPYAAVAYVEIDDIVPNTKYTLSMVIANGNKVYVNEELASFIQIVGDGTRKQVTITTRSNLSRKDYGQYLKGKGWILLKNAPDNTVVSDTQDIQLELGTTPTSYEPYHEQTVTLPYTLNAIPVSSGGNVTIGGQQYIADYVDVERGKLVRCVGVSSQDTFQVADWDNSGVITIFDTTAQNVLSAEGHCMVTISKSFSYRWTADKYAPHHFTQRQGQTLVIVLPKTVTTVEQGKAIRDKGFKFYYELAVPTETDLTQEEIQAFKELATHYPVTNVNVTSEQLGGYTVFNYPVSMENGWNYVKQQLNDNRDYIYDMDVKTQDIDTQSAEAYVNSEYAVALTELEV